MVVRIFKTTAIAHAPTTATRGRFRTTVTAHATVLARVTVTVVVMVKIYSKETPSESTVFGHIKSLVPWDEAVAPFRPRRETLSIPGLTFDPVSLDQEVRHLYKTVGSVLWKSKPNGSTYGLSVSINPEHHPDDWRHASFGHSRYASIGAFEYYKAVEEDVANRVRGDYLDSYGFRRLLPAVSECQLLSGILSRFKVPLVRCSIRTLNGYLCVPNARVNSGYHQDDSPLEVMRINLCVTNNGDFGFQYAGEEVDFPEPGNHYVVNTDIDHRIVVARQSNFQRTHIILGVAPWFDYDIASDSWAPNKWFGVKHPYDMAKEGLLFF